MATGTPSIGQVQLDLILNSQNFQTQLQTAVRTSVNQAMNAQMRSQVNSVFSKLGGIAAAAFSAKALVDFGKKAIKLGSDLVEVQNVVDVTFTTMSKDIDKFAKSALNNFGLSETVAKRYAGTMGTMAQSFGFTEKQAYNMSTTLTALSGDVASFYNLSSDEAYNKLKAVFTGETEGLKALGVVMTQTALDQFAMEKGFKKTTKQMSEQEKVALRYLFVQEGLNNAMGDFTRSQDSWANQMRILAGNWEKFQTNMGQGLIVLLKPVVQTLNKIMTTLVKFSMIFNDAMQALFGKDKSQSTQMQQNAESAANLADNIENVGDEAKKTAKKLKSLMGFDELNILTAQADSDSGIADSLSIIGDMGLDSMTRTFDEFDKALEITKADLKKFEDAFATFANIITGFAVEEALSLILRFLGKTGPLATLAAVLGGLGTAIEGFALLDTWILGSSWEDNIQALIGSGLVVASGATIGQMFGNAVKGAGWGAIIAGIPMFIVGLKDAITEGINWINAFLTASGATLIGAGIGALFGPTGAAVGALVGLIVGAITDLGVYVYQNYDKIKKWLTNWFSDLEDGFNLWIDDINDTLGEFFGPIITGILSTGFELFRAFFIHIQDEIDLFKKLIDDIIDFLTSVFAGDWEKAWEGLKNIVVDVFNGIVGLLKGSINGVIALINGAINGINRLHVKLPDFLGGDIQPNIANIPYLAQGGYVGPNNPRLAVIGDNKHEGEIVAPESKISEAVSAEMTPIISMLQQMIVALQRQGNQGDIVIPIYLDGSVIDNYVINSQRRTTLRSGGTM